MSSHPEPRRFTPSNKNAPGFIDAEARAHTAGAFQKGASLYDDFRPTYPSPVAELVDKAKTVIDVGAGTGKLTELLVGDDRKVLAVDPSADMISVLRQRIPSVHAWQATAEATGLKAASVDAYVSAQTWHWVDIAAASAEADRVVVPEGQLMLCWNTLDVSHPWVLRYSRISHSGDVHREGFYPEVDKPWVLKDGLRMRWIQEATPSDLFELAKTRSYWLRANSATRAKVEANLEWYLYERLGFDEGDVIPLPYRTDAFVYERA
ncbi:class I SAM-dependent methyltransferase [Corynebacterium meitnerae]|uniref:Class I SAM-dependent methyltransferase n=1 Tax=Corynebacterium meitnerae TaxID=2913498 RepID=A0A9X3RI43_9CORY|nr:class I SAM-dependent methyltransferase [Corynebacterium meitnerae]MCZ9292969.1 class I SAM-dependent methyltransferase [Corynebacterium meitnerae]